MSGRSVIDNALSLIAALETEHDALLQRSTDFAVNKEAQLKECLAERDELKENYRRIEQSHIQIEKEANKLRKRIENTQYDTDRINWMDKNMDCDLSGSGLHIRRVEVGVSQTLREAIDDARKGE